MILDDETVKRYEAELEKIRRDCQLPDDDEDI